MTRLVWDTPARRYEAGVDRGVFYPAEGPGEVWNGLTSVQESPSGEEVIRYIDGVRVTTSQKVGDFEGTIEAFTYPLSMYGLVIEPRFPKPFGFSYRTQTESSYKIHLVYNVLFTPLKHVYEQEETTSFSWPFTTRPIRVGDLRPTAHFFVEADQTEPETLAIFENLIYGNESEDPRLPTGTELLAIFETI